MVNHWQTICLFVTEYSESSVCKPYAVGFTALDEGLPTDTTEVAVNGMDPPELGFSPAESITGTSGQFQSIGLRRHQPNRVVIHWLFPPWWRHLACLYITVIFQCTDFAIWAAAEEHQNYANFMNAYYCRSRLSPTCLNVLLIYLFSGTQGGGGTSLFWELAWVSEEGAGVLLLPVSSGTIYDACFSLCRAFSLQCFPYSIVLLGKTSRRTCTWCPRWTATSLFPFGP